MGNSQSRDSGRSSLDDMRDCCDESCVELEKAVVEVLCGGGRLEEQQEKLLAANAVCIGVVSAWIAARERGDVKGAAAHVHPDFVFKSEHVTISGREVARDKLFGQKAPIPTEILQPLQVVAHIDQERRPLLYREVVFHSGADKAAIRQEWEMQWMTQDRVEQGSKPLIRRLAASHVHARAADEGASDGLDFMPVQPVLSGRM